MTNTSRHIQQSSHHHKSPALRLQGPNSGSSEDALFTIDRRGDVQNLRYGSVDRYKVPRYRLFGRGRLLGLDRRFKIISKTETERTVDDEAIDHSSKTTAFTSLLKHQVNNDSHFLAVPQSLDRDDFGDQRNYVAFGHKRRRLSTEPGDEARVTHSAESYTFNDTSSDSDSSITSPLTQNAPSIGAHSSEQDAFEVFKNHPDNKRHIELRRLLDQEPQNLSAWLDLIHHQERYYLASADTGRKSLNPSQRAIVADMRMSLYQKAIAAVKDKQAKETLISGMMEEGSKIWDMNQQTREWAVALRDSRSLDLWYKFLNFQQTNAIAFSYERCLQAFTTVFEIVSSHNGEEHDYHAAYLLLRLTRFMYEAGFAERAIALWQALLEYNLLKPGNEDDSIQAFEIFWETEYARIGEVGAKGWHSNHKHEVSPASDVQLNEIDPSRLYMTWGKSELQRSISDVMPARTLDDTVEDDPFRVILFSDIKDFMLRVKTEHGKTFLIQAFLKFCSLPPLFDSHGRCREWWLDPHLCDFIPGTVPTMVTDTDIVFAPLGSPTYPWGQLKLISEPLLNFACRSLGQLAENLEGNDWLAEYVIALHTQRDVKAARKIAKTLLKRRSNSLLLYNAYALVEQRADKAEVADNVWSTALSMADGLSSCPHHHKAALWHSWVWELLGQQRYSQAQNLLAQAASSELATAPLLQAATQTEPVSSQQLLRSDAYFENQISMAVAQKDEAVVDLTALYAISKYLSNDHSLDAVVQAYHFTLSIYIQKSHFQVVEQLHQGRAKFAQFHALQSKTGYKPKEVVQLLRDSLSRFPQNWMFFDLHEIYMRQAGIVDKIRTLDSKDEVSAGSVSHLLQNLSKELSRPVYSGATTHSVRNNFAKAAATDSELRHSPSIWQSWLRWEISQTNGTAKDIYLSALRSCPWAKDLYLLGYVELSLETLVGPIQLGHVYRSMTERGLRVRHDIMEVLDDLLVKD